MTAQAPTDIPGEKGDLSSAAQGNLDLLTNFYEREAAKISGMQLVIERISAFLGSPIYFAVAAAFIVVWVAVNSWGMHVHWRHYDQPPFFWLQGLLSSNALLLTVAVLSRQNRMGRLAEHHAHLDLQINLLTEQKVTKILQLVDELRRDMPVLRGRPDAEVVELTKPADAEAILQAVKQKNDER
jgi:uncharacterized membrane protein